MGFLSVRTYQFRNLDDAVISVDAPEIFLIGENGQGKTNFLESVYLLCYGSSFRTRNASVLSRQSTSYTVIAGTITNEEFDEQRIDVEIEKRRKNIRIDGKPVKDRKELISIMPCIVFSHDDIQFVKGSPDMQRWFFNQTLSLYDPLFIDSLRRYSKVLKLRNQVLKEEQRKMVDIYDLQLVEAGMSVEERRAVTVTEFNETFKKLFREIAGFQDDLQIRYRPSWPQTDAQAEVLDLLRRKRETDFTLGTTTTGPHRDRFVFTYRGKDFSRIASTGQLRLISLILRTAQARFFSDKRGKKPLLLLDDVLLELDLKRRKKFIDALPEYEQIFYTFLPDEPFSSYRRDDTLIYQVENGRIWKP
jgi:DNA replication and repair protein RecF